MTDQFTITKSAGGEGSSPLPSPPDLTLQETDEIEGGDGGDDGGDGDGDGGDDGGDGGEE
jgi:hypothetical protein